MRLTVPVYFGENVFYFCKARGLIGENNILSQIVQTFRDITHNLLLFGRQLEVSPHKKLLLGFLHYFPVLHDTPIEGFHLSRESIDGALQDLNRSSVPGRQQGAQLVVPVSHLPDDALSLR